MNNKKIYKNEYEIIFGIHPILEAIHSGHNIEKIFIKQNTKISSHKDLRQLAEEKNIPLQYVPEEKIKNYTKSNNTQGVIAIISKIEYHNIENIIPIIYEKGQNPFLVILDSITDVRNLGAIARTCECAGVHSIVIPTKNTAPVNSVAIKSSAGALTKIPICRVNNLKKTIEYLKKTGIKCIASFEKGDKNYFEIDYNMPIALIFGSEEKGINKEVLKIVDETIKIPMHGSIQSLNVSVAAGIVIFEALKNKLIY